MYFGMWRSLVARTAGGREVASSSLVIPTKHPSKEGFLIATNNTVNIQFMFLQVGYNKKRQLIEQSPVFNAGGKSGQHRTRQLLTATGGNSRESATETIPPVWLLRPFMVRVKGVG